MQERKQKLQDKALEETAHSTARGWRTFSLWMLLATTIIGLDQVTKSAIIRWLPKYDHVPLTSFLNITHHQNEGAAFSLLADAGGWQRWFFTGLASVVSVVLVVWLYQLRSSREWVLSSGLALVLGGAVGNLIDRVRLGYVTDFIQVLFGSWAFPSFNVADAAISVGAALLIIDALFVSGRKDNKSS